MTAQIQTATAATAASGRVAAKGTTTGSIANSIASGAGLIGRATTRGSDADLQSISAWQQVLRSQAGLPQEAEAASMILEEDASLGSIEQSPDQALSLGHGLQVSPLQQHQGHSGHGGSADAEVNELEAAELADADTVTPQSSGGHTSLLSSSGSTLQAVDSAPDLPHVQAPKPELLSEKQQMMPLSTSRSGDPSAVTIHFQKDSLSGTAMQLTRHAGSWQLTAMAGNAVSAAQLQSQSAVLVQRFSQRLGKLEVDVVGHSERKRIPRPDESGRDMEVSVDVEDR
tara:strand:- start:18311 stop:19165 length:855 start_codon:yes stop_codon:yes gene_type:complete